MTRTRSGSPTSCSTSAPAPACMAATSSRRARPATSWTRRLAHRQVSHRRAGDRDAGAARHRPAPHPESDQRARQQSEERHRRNPARPVHRRHRRLGRRQVDAAGRHALPRGGAPPQRRQRGPRAARPARRARTPRQGDRHRPVADRPHAALEPRDLHRRVHADPRMVRRPARRRRRAATSRGASRST